MDSAIRSDLIQMTRLLRGSKGPVRETNWHVITGAPCSGKTTIIQELKNLGYRVIHEIARAYIEAQINNGNTLDQIKSDLPAFQRHILYEKVKIEKNLPPDQIIFMDRAVPDSIAYFKCAGLGIDEPLSLSKHVRYKKIFLFERFDFRRDNVRLEDNQEAALLERLLVESYERLGYEPVMVPHLTVQERTDLILKHIETG
jgi:predicted ATPase